MSGVLEKNLPQFIYTDQINYPNHIRLFVVSVIFIILIDYFLISVSVFAKIVKDCSSKLSELIGFNLIKSL